MSTESQHLYYLSKKLLEQLEKPKPIFLIGSRGSGKTTLLKVLSWEEQLRNKSLQRQLSSNTLERGYIGTYVKLPTIQLDAFRVWLEGKPAIRLAIRVLPRVNLRPSFYRILALLAWRQRYAWDFT